MIARKLWRLFLYLVKTKKTWRWPRVSDVLIYDAQGHESLLEFLSPWNPEVLHVRGEQLSIPILLTSLPGFARLNRSAYIDRFVRTVRPRLIVSYTDNDPSFYSLATRHKNITTLLIQNGIRTIYGHVFEHLDPASSARSGFKVDYMMMFGRHIGDQYARFIQGSTVPVGSLVNNSVPRRKATTPGTLAYVSQYRESQREEIDGRVFTRAEYYEQADRLVLTSLIRYAREHGKTFSIIACSNIHSNRQRYDREKRYYRDLLGHDCDVLRESDQYAGYDAVDATEVVVALESTLGYESAARGNKTAFFCMRLEPWGMPGQKFGWPGGYADDGPFWTNRQDPDAFDRILDYLFSITDEEWQVQLKQQGFDDIMAYDPGNTVLRSVLRQELGPPPS